MAPLTSFDQILGVAPRGLRIAVAGANDSKVLDAIKLAVDEGILEGGILFMSRQSHHETMSLVQQTGLTNRGFSVYECEDDAKTCKHATAAARCGDANILMKGFVQTSGFMRAVLNSETGLGTGRVLSQTGIYQVPFMDKLILVADVGIVITPDLQQLAGIASNAVQVATALGIQEPKVAMLSPAETVNPAMPGNSNAALITRMAERGQIEGAAHASFDGPLALDNAISPDAAVHKKISSKVAGKADVLIVPDLNSGNMLAKSIIYLARARAAGVVTGASCPIVLTSRAGSPVTKLNSIAVAAILSHKEG